MTKEILFQKPVLVSGRLPRDYLDDLEYLFFVTIADPNLVGTPREKAGVSFHRIASKITRILRINWHLEDDEIEKVVFQRTKEYVEEKIKTVGSLEEEESLILMTKTEPEDCPYTIANIPNPDGYKFTMEVGNNGEQIERFRKIKILFLAVNPVDSIRLRLDEESRAIDEVLRQADFYDKFEIVQQWAVRTGDIQRHLLRHQPTIVHFTGHGTHTSELILEDNNGKSRPVSVDTLSKLFSLLKDNIQCVVLNACFSKQQARAIAQHIDCVIGMSGAIGDAAAISFASAFYQALGFGKDIQTAFDLGRLQIGLNSLDDKDMPELFAINVRPEEVVITGNNQ